MPSVDLGHASAPIANLIEAGLLLLLLVAVVARCLAQHLKVALQPEQALVAAMRLDVVDDWAVVCRVLAAAYSLAGSACVSVTDEDDLSKLLPSAGLVPVTPWGGVSG